MRVNFVRGRAALLAAVCALVLNTGAWADSPAGMIKNIRGSVTISRNSQIITPVPGDAVMASDLVMTGRDGAVGIALKDDTLLSYGPNSAVRLDNFKFDSTTHEGSILLSVTRGTMKFVTGLVGKLAPQAVSVKLPNATIGIRGTEFLVEVVPPEEAP